MWQQTATHLFHPDIRRAGIEAAYGIKVDHVLLYQVPAADLQALVQLLTHSSSATLPTHGDCLPFASWEYMSESAQEGLRSMAGLAMTSTLIRALEGRRVVGPVEQFYRCRELITRCLTSVSIVQTPTRIELIGFFVTFEPASQLEDSIRSSTARINFDVLDSISTTELDVPRLLRLFSWMRWLDAWYRPTAKDLIRELIAQRN